MQEDIIFNDVNEPNHTDLNHKSKCESKKNLVKNNSSRDHINNLEIQRKVSKFNEINKKIERNINKENTNLNNNNEFNAIDEKIDNKENVLKNTIKSKTHKINNNFSNSKLNSDEKGLFMKYNTDPDKNKNVNIEKKRKKNNNCNCIIF